MFGKLLCRKQQSNCFVFYFHLNNIFYMLLNTVVTRKKRRKMKFYLDFQKSETSFFAFFHLSLWWRYCPPTNLLLEVLTHTDRNVASGQEEAYQVVISWQSWTPLFVPTVSKLPALLPRGYRAQWPRHHSSLCPLNWSGALWLCERTETYPVPEVLPDCWVWCDLVRPEVSNFHIKS